MTTKKAIYGCLVLVLSGLFWYCFTCHEKVARKPVVRSCGVIIEAIPDYVDYTSRHTFVMRFGNEYRRVHPPINLFYTKNPGDSVCFLDIDGHRHDSLQALALLMILFGAGILIFVLLFLFDND